MIRAASRHATLLVGLPADRYRPFPDGRAPAPGDVVVLDQAFTGPDDAQMVLVYGEASGRDLYEAEVYTTEIRILPASDRRAQGGTR